MTDNKLHEPSPQALAAYLRWRVSHGMGVDPQLERGLASHDALMWCTGWQERDNDKFGAWFEGSPELNRITELGFRR
jgi:hypothetical protein